MRKQAHSETVDLTKEDIAALLTAAIGSQSQAAWARDNGTFAPDVNKVIHCKDWPTKAICKALGIERVPHVYRMSIVVALADALAAIEGKK